jgi:hypothetical protein
MFAELCEFLKDGPLPYIIFILVRHHNGCVEHIHDKFSIVAFRVNVIVYFDSARKNEIILLVIDPIHFSYDFSHAWGSSS